MNKTRIAIQNDGTARAILIASPVSLDDRKITNKENTVTAFALPVVALESKLAYAIAGAVPRLIGGRITNILMTRKGD